MLRSFSLIESEIKRCQSQIAATFDEHTPENTTQTMVIREGFQAILKNLYDEKSTAIRNIEVINPRIVRTDEPEILGIQRHPLDRME